LRDSTSWRRKPDNKGGSETNPTVLKGFLHLARFLIREVKIMEDSTADDKQRRAVHGGIPTEMTQDPADLARELRWRCKRALGEDSEDEVEKARSAVVPEKPRMTKRRKLENGRAGSQAVDKQLIVFGPGAKTKNAANE
jgi:hypothetical protein